MNIDRRHFIKQIGLAAGGLGTLGLLPGDLHALSKIKTPFKPIRVKGRVTSQGKALNRVVVTDGQSVVATDSNGYFDFVSNNQEDFVYLSLPSGYEIPKLQNGSAAFFKKLDKGKSEVSLSFELNPLTESDNHHHFLVLADTQIQNDYEAEQLLTVAAPDIAQTVNDIGAANIFGIGCGDLVFDKLHMFKDYNDAVQATKIPFFQVLGNHDVDMDVRSDEMTSATFKSHFGPTYYSFNRGEIHYVVLDDVFFLGSNKNYVGYITEKQLAWLEQDLKFVAPGSTVVVSLHIPPMTGAVSRYPERDHKGGTVSNRDSLYELLQPFHAHIMSGHTHFNDNRIHGKIYEHCHGTVCGAWWSGPICYDGTPNGYGVYEAKGSSISWGYKSTGLKKDHQFRFYEAGSNPEFPEHNAINVWNCDPEWKMSWYEDGIRKGALQQITSFDPLSVSLHQGPELPQLRKWIEPQLTDHMFYFKPEKGAGSVVVEVIDRFGNVYSEAV